MVPARQTKAEISGKQLEFPASSKILPRISGGQIVTLPRHTVATTNSYKRIPLDISDAKVRIDLKYLM